MALIKEAQDYERGGKQKDFYAADEVVDVACPLCGSDEKISVFQEHGAVGVVRCARCSLIFTSPRIKAPEQVYWGDGNKYYAESRLIFDGKTPHHRDPNYLEEIRLIEHYQPKGG